MSRRRRNASSSRSRRRSWLPPQLSLDEDLPLSMLLALAHNKPQKKTPMRKSTPRKRTLKSTTPASEVVVIDDDEMDNINTYVSSKSKNQLSVFLSDDDDDKSTNDRKVPLVPLDSDDDISVFSPAQPSTSSGSTSKATIQTKDVDMEFLDSIIGENPVSHVEEPISNMKSLEEYMKETEQLLQEAASRFEEIKSGSKPKPEVSSNDATPNKVVVGPCPVCFESLNDRPASATVCGHIFCTECISHIAKTSKKCPSCRKAVGPKKFHSIHF